MKQWYEQSFGSDYMIVYRHRDWENANKEIAQMMRWLELPLGAQVLDIGCGMGRHAAALAASGYQVTGVDLSEVLLEEARLHDPSGSINWVHGDMRALPFASGSFDATVNLFTSFGYFSLEEDNIRVLQHIRRVLRTGGSFLIDFMNPLYVQRNLVPQSERLDEESGVYIKEVRSIQDGWVQKEITLYELDRPNDVRQYLERVRLYPIEWFQRHLAESALYLVRLYGNYDGSEYDANHSPRMIMTGVAK